MGSEFELYPTSLLLSAFSTCSNILFLTLQVNVSDDTKVEYQISGMGVDEEPKGVLRINRDTGELFVVKKVDREKHQSLKVSLTWHYTGGPCSYG